MRQLVIGVAAFAVFYLVMSALLFLLGGMAGTVEVIIVFVIAVIAGFVVARMMHARGNHT
jgi:hypothetical protein